MLRQVCVDATTPKRIVSDGGAPVSVQVGSDPSSASRSYHLYNAHGDGVDLSDTQGNLAATYSYDGRDGARDDAPTGLYWLAAPAYAPSLGRFLSRDPLGRAPLFFSDNPL